MVRHKGYHAVTRGGEPFPLRILFVTSMHPSSRSPQRGVTIRRQAEALRGLGHTVECVELGDAGGPVRYLLARRRVRAALHDVDPHLIHVHFGYSGLAVPHTSI